MYLLSSAAFDREIEAPGFIMFLYFSQMSGQVKGQDQTLLAKPATTPAVKRPQRELRMLRWGGLIMRSPDTKVAAGKEPMFFEWGLCKDTGYKSVIKPISVKSTVHKNNLLQG